jgi:ADP-ribosylglycohydrolase
VTVVDPDVLRARLRHEIRDQAARGRAVDVDALDSELAALPAGWDALIAFADRLAAVPVREDWPYDEPDDLDGIRTAADPSRATGPLGSLDPDDAAARAEAAFIGSVCGCMLGKPLEIDPTLVEIRAALEPAGEWPLDDYLTEAVVLSLREQQGQWPELVRERITHVAPDDDINYTVLGLVNLEQHGLHFTPEQLLRLWLYNLPVLATFGPERTLLASAAVAALEPGLPQPWPLQRWATVLNPGAELCGALIRADAYGYACLGHPERAAELAWRDAAMTHRGTGLYGAMFVAAAIAAAPFSAGGREVFATALRYVPQRSRFAEAVSFALEATDAATDWIDGYERIHARFGEFGHCRVLQEVGTLVNTLHFATDVGDGICKQVMQGNDTDSFGATAGSILGAFFGPGHLAPRWTDPFDDRIHLALAAVWETSLSALAARMGQLPALGRA